ncbi:MAG TPA: sensor histidine kinase [Actinocrinis sp.]|nr:sensor histidine kinase [Actinocrinis sp.]
MGRNQTFEQPGAIATGDAAGQRGAHGAARHGLLLRLLRPLLVVAVVTTIVEVAAHSTPRPAVHGSGLLVTLALASIAAGLFGGVYTITAPQPDPVFAGGIALATASSLALVWLQPLDRAGLTGMATVTVLLVACLRQRPRLLAALIGGEFVVLVAESWRGRTLPASLSLCFPILGVYVLTMLFQRMRNDKEQAETLLAHVEATRHAQAEAAALAERQHLAREMHDVLAHSLSGLMLHLEGARMLAGSSPSDPRLPLAVDRAHELAKEGLTEARHAIGMLRDEQLPGPEALHTLTGQFTRHSGIPCMFVTSGTPLPIRPDARLAVYRVTQEALTNVVKHAHADRVDVRLAYVGDQVNLTIEDFGAGRDAVDSLASAPARDSGGYGLTGMRERAELLGGTLVAAATATGFRVELRVPA